MASYAFMLEEFLGKRDWTLLLMPSKNYVRMERVERTSQSLVMVLQQQSMQNFTEKKTRFIVDQDFWNTTS